MMKFVPNLPVSQPLIGGVGLRLPNRATPPPNVYNVLGQRGISQSEVDAMGWRAYPKLGEHGGQDERRSGRELAVDAQALVEPLLDRPELAGTLRTMDVLNGCLNQCDTCYADSPLPSKIFSFDSLKGLFRDSRFIGMLQSQSLRIGSIGDLTNHPRGAEIAEMILDSTLPSELGMLKLWANYRKANEAVLDGLLDLAAANPYRSQMTISLPFNRDDAVNLAFQEYMGRRPNFFDLEFLETMENGLFLMINSGIRHKNISIHNVRDPILLFPIGRVLPGEILEAQLPDHRTLDTVKAPIHRFYRERGLVKTYLNPDALWLKVYATTRESHTTNVYTPITPHNLSALSHLGYHPDFLTPPNWPGGRGARADWR